MKLRMAKATLRRTTTDEDHLWPVAGGVHHPPPILEDREMNDWQPAETAPRDGTPFRAYGEALIDPDFNPCGQVEAVFDGEGFIGAVWNGQHDIWNTSPIQFTHWQTMPESPR